MKRTTRLLLQGLLLVLIIVAGTVYASVTGYDISWWTVDSGGGTTVGNGYTLSGTIGQSDADVLTSNGYTLAGGSWGGVATEYAVYLPVVLGGEK